MLDQIHVATCMLWPWWVKRFLFIQNKMFIPTFCFQFISKNNICIYYVIDWISLHAESNLCRVSFDILFSFVVYHLLNMNKNLISPAEWWAMFTLGFRNQNVIVEIAAHGKEPDRIVHWYCQCILPYTPKASQAERKYCQCILTHVKLMFV